MDRFTEEQISKGMFNDDQVDYMRYLASLPRETKCDCGWYLRKECDQWCRTGGRTAPTAPPAGRRGARRAGMSKYCEHGWRMECAADGFGHSLHYSRSMDCRAQPRDPALRALQRLIELEDEDTPAEQRADWQRRWHEAVRAARQVLRVP